MNSFIQIGCLLAVTFALYGISPSSACIQGLLECEEIMTKLDEDADIPTTCKAFKRTRACLDNLQCPDDLKYQVELISSSLDEMVPICLTDETSPVGLHDDSCLKIAHCVGPEFNKAIVNKNTDEPTKCRLFQDALNCMNPLIEKCLPSLNPAMKVLFTTQRDEMQASADQQCKAYRVKDGPPKVTRNAQNPACLKITECLSNDFHKSIKVKNTDTKTICRQFQEVIECLNPLIDQCLPTVDEDLRAMFTMHIEQMQKNKEINCKGVLPSQSVGATTGSNGIVSSTGACGSDYVKCHDEYVLIAKFNQTELCKAHDKVIECMEKIKCDDAIGKQWKSKLEMIKQNKIDDCEGGGPNGECNATAQCSNTTEVCDVHKCVGKMWDKCARRLVFEQTIKGELRQKYEEGKGTCSGGCGNLKPSIFFILTAAILISFVQVFKN